MTFHAEKQLINSHIHLIGNHSCFEISTFIVDLDVLLYDLFIYFISFLFDTIFCSFMYQIILNMCIDIVAIIKLPSSFKQFVKVDKL